MIPDPPGLSPSEADEPIDEPAITPRIVTPSGLAPELLDAEAVHVVRRLASRGHEAYLVGGCVRDLLLGRTPKDFDIATAARPAQVKRTFPRNCRVIGRRFKLAHLHFQGGRKIIEVSTFRRTPESTGSDDDDDLLIVHDNEFGTAAEDALRRDLTVNALFYDPVDDRILDYVGGIEDLHDRTIRTIGDPFVRFREDPVRILRAAKFAGRLGFVLAEDTRRAMAHAAPDLARSATPRILEEILRLLRGGHAFESFQILRDVGAIPVILPLVGRYLEQSQVEERLVFWRLLEALDGRIHAGAEPPAPGVLLGALFCRPVLLAAERDPDVSPTLLAEELLGDLSMSLRLPRRDAGCLKRVCGVQPRFAGHGPRRFRAASFVRDPFFTAALQLFELQCDATGDPECREQVSAWRERHRLAMADDQGEADTGDSEAETTATAADDGDEGGREGRRRRRRRLRPRRGGEAEVGTERAAEDVADDDYDAEPEADREDAGSEQEREPERDDDAGRRSGRRRRRRRGRSRRGGEVEAEVADADAAGDELAEADADADAPEQERGPDDDEGRGARRRRRRRGRRGRGKATAAEAHGGDDDGDRADGPADVAAARSRDGEDDGDGDARSTGRKGRTRRKRRSRKGGRQPQPDQPADRTDFDRKVLDKEVDPRAVPTFGALVEDKRRKRAPRITVEQEFGDPYRPPPLTPGSHDPAPPPPPPPSDDEFGDW